MATKTFEIIDFSKIQSFSVKVTEEIGEKYLLDFLRTSLENQIDVGKNSKFYYHYIFSSLSYEIIYFNESVKHSIPEPFIFIEECGVDTKELFITQNYFCLFDSKVLVLYKEIQNILQEDIQTYIEQLYKIKIDNVTVVDNKKYVQVKNKFLSQTQKYSFNFHPLKKDNSFKIFSLYSVLIIIVFLFSLYVAINTNQHTIAKSEDIPLYEKGYKKLYSIYKKSEEKSINSSMEFFDYIASYNIFIEKLNYKNGTLNIILEDNNRKKLLQTISNYTKTIKVRSIQFDKSSNRYKMDIAIDAKK